MFGWIKSQVFGNGVSKPAAQVALTENAVYNIARSGTLGHVESMLSQHPQWANEVLDCAILHDRWSLIYIASKHGAVIDSPSLLCRAMQHGDIETAIALAECGSPIPDKLEGLIADVCGRTSRSDLQCRLLKAIFDRHDVNSIDYERLVAEFQSNCGLRDVSAMLHEFGYDFTKTGSISVVYFLHRCILSLYEGELCDLMTWGQEIDFEHPHFDNPLESHQVIKWKILQEKSRAERMIIERTAANIAQALMNESLVPSEDAPQRKRRM
ncbi:hypothetical protein IAE41_01845 [Stenotrophomonas sp. S39]|nr:hypothetical protein [Stenotrophomonas sp. S39]